MDDSQDEFPKDMPKRKPVANAPMHSWDTTPHVFIAVVLVSMLAFSWPLRWTISGAPLLVYSLLLGEVKGHRVLPYIPLWTIFSSLNLVYVVCATSWLLYWVFAAACYPVIILVCVVQFEYCAGLARRAFRTFLYDLHFIKDKVAFFNLPALEIDTDTSGLFLVRGVTFSLSTLTVVAHGVEVGIKLSEDMELAIQAEKVTVALFRRIDIGDVYANVKGGEWEMTFGSLKPNSTDPADDAFLARDTTILRAATAALDGSLPLPEKDRMKMTGGKPPKDTSDPSAALGSIKQVSPNEEKASEAYNDLLRHISETVTVNMAREALANASDGDEEGSTLDFDNMDDLRAAICAHIHDQPSIPHPPSRSIRLTTLKKTNYPAFKKFLHRLPLLLRLLLNPLSYFHPINIESITAVGSGRWFVQLMQTYFFKHHSTQDQEIRRLEARISAWLADANFAVEMTSIHCLAQVPINTSYDIECHFKMGDLMAYRILPKAVNLVQVIRLGGADAIFTIPSFLLPHHEHILPPKPTVYDKMELEQKIKDAEGTPQEVRKQAALEQLRKDEANMTISAHAHLPARFHQDLLNFTAAMVKATKVIENDRDFEEVRTLRELKRVESTLSDTDVSSMKSSDSLVDPDNKGFKNFFRKVDTGFKEAGTNMREGMRKAGLNTASAVANDRWIAKLVGKILMKLEKAQGDIGYSGNIPISLQEHRAMAEPESKILP